MMVASVMQRSTSLIPPELRRFLFLLQRRLFNLIGWLSTAREIYLPPTPPTALFRRSRPTGAQSPILPQASVRATWRSTRLVIFSRSMGLPARSSNILHWARERPLPVLGSI